MTAIETVGLTRKFGDFVAVDGINLSVKEGELFGLLGPNGAGKTTMISMLTAMLRISGGTALVNGADVSRQPGVVRKSIGIVFQDPSLDLDLTARENLDFHAKLYGPPQRLASQRITDVLRLVELDSRSNSIVKTFSGGMKRRLEIGQLSRLRLRLMNEGSNGSVFLVKVFFSQAGEEEYSYAEYTPFLAPGKTILLTLKEPVIIPRGGSHLMRVQVFKMDGKELVGAFTQSFELGGVLRYDVMVSCLESSVLPGTEIPASMTLLNLGDFFQDTQVSWWIESPTGKKIGLHSMPIALYRKETRELVRSIPVPKNASLGEYAFKVEVRYSNEVREAQCSFLVQRNEDHYRSELGFLQERLNELKRIVDLAEKDGTAVSDYRERIRRTSQLLASLREAIDGNDWEKSDAALRNAKKELDNLSEELALLNLPIFWFAGIGMDPFFVFLAVTLSLTVIALLYETNQLEKDFGRLRLLDSKPFFPGAVRPVQREKKKDSMLDRLIGIQKKGKPVEIKQRPFRNK
jgi:ABC-type branched-subunit amino acid transport system ATPase component